MSVTSEAGPTTVPATEAPQQVPTMPETPFVETSEAPAPTPEGTESAEASPAAEIDHMLPEPSEEFELANGSMVKVAPLKMRELLKLLRIVTRGGAVLLPTLRFNGVSASDFAVQFVSIVTFAIPEAEEQAVEFVQAITLPADLQEGDSQAVRSFNQQQINDLYVYLNNPELEDFVSIIERLVYREKDNLQSLGKRLQTMFKLAERTGQLGKTSQ